MPGPAIAQEPAHPTAADHSLDTGIFTVRGFADVSFRAEHLNPAKGGSTGTPTTFSLGQFSLFLSARIADNVSIVSETAFALASDVRQAQTVTLERIYIKYVLSDALKIAAGRTHTALGYWNEAFHHGALLHPTVARPEILRFGGVMPVHSVGLEVSGRVPAAGWEISYVGNLANGRARDFSATQGAVDVNREKVTVGKVSFAREAEQTIIFGAMVYRDVIPSDATRPGRAAAVTETIPGIHVVYRDPRVEFFSEHFWIRHVNQDTAATLRHHGWYAIGVLRPRRWKPYAGIDVAQFAAGDVYFAGGDTSVRRYLGGIRYDVNAQNAIKFEYRNEHRTLGVTHALVINTAFAF